jgi:fluoride exporter
MSAPDSPNVPSPTGPRGRVSLTGFLARALGRQALGRQALGRQALGRQAFGREGNPPIDPDLDPNDPGEPGREHRPSRGQVRRANPSILGSIAAGGFLGALARYEVGIAFPAYPGGFPTATFVVNTSGAFAIGVVLTLILERFSSRTLARPFACVGFLGAWTTVSTLAADSVLLTRDGRILLAVGYVASTLVCGITATAVGIWAARRITR